MFRVVALVSTDETYILLRSIESIKQDKAADGEIIDVLKNDITLTVITVSGKEYEISVAKQMEIYKAHGSPQDKFAMRNLIIDHWLKTSHE